MSWVVERITDASTLPFRMTSFLWKWEVSCITWVSRELSKFSGLTTTSQTACVEGRLTRCIDMILRGFFFKALCLQTRICSNFLFSLLCQQNNISPAEISQWTNHRVMEWLRSVDLAEYAPNLRGSGVHGGLMVSPALLSHPEGYSPLDRSIFKIISLLRFWSHGSMWRPWLYCWTFLPTRRCCAATWPLISACWLAQRPSSTNKSVLKTQTTHCSPLPPKWR